MHELSSGGGGHARRGPMKGSAARKAGLVHEDTDNEAGREQARHGRWEGKQQGQQAAARGGGAVAQRHTRAGRRA